MAVLGCPQSSCSPKDPVKVRFLPPHTSQRPRHVRAMRATAGPQHRYDAAPLAEPGVHHASRVGRNRQGILEVTEINGRLTWPGDEVIVLECPGKWEEMRI